MVIKWKEVFIQAAGAVVIAFFAVVLSNQETSKINTERMLEVRDDVEELRQRIAVLEGLHFQ